MGFGGLRERWATAHGNSASIARGGLRDPESRGSPDVRAGDGLWLIAREGKSQRHEAAHSFIFLNHRNRKDSMETETRTHKLSNKERNEEVEEALRSVIQILIDGQEGFEKLGEHLTVELSPALFCGGILTRRSPRRSGRGSAPGRRTRHEEKERSRARFIARGGTSRSTSAVGIIRCWRPRKPGRIRRRRRIKKRLKRNCRCPSSNFWTRKCAYPGVT